MTRKSFETITMALAKQTLHNGQEYQGDWSEGLKEGQGKLKFSCGDQYDGEFS